MELQDRIIAYVTASNGLVSLDKLVLVAKPAGFSEGEVLATLSKIGKKLKATARGGMVYYQVPPAPKPISDHGAWGRANYPNTNLLGIPIPFYSSVTDGPDEVYTLATRAFYKQKNEELKRSYDKEKDTRVRPKARHFAVPH